LVNPAGRYGVTVRTALAAWLVPDLMGWETW
jgi:hypothetical protein